MFGPIPSTLITLDFETYYSNDYSLTKLTTEAYVRDPRFEAIGVSVKLEDRPAVWMEADDFRTWAARVDWARVAMIAQHAQFDGLVLSHHFGIRPGFWYCTLSMARALRGPGKGNGLAALAEQYGIGAKGHEVHDAKGKRRRDFTPEEWLRYGAYSCNDGELTHQLFRLMRVGFPEAELWLIDTTIRMFTEPTLVGNQDVLTRALEAERERKRAVLKRAAESAGIPIGDDPLEAARAVLASNEKFGELLKSFSVDPPLKDGKNGQIYAFAKSDPGMQALLDHENGEVRALAESRLTVKSTIVETRVERFLGTARRGPMPVYLKYCGAHTHRWSGGDKSNWQNMNRGGVLRDSVEAPPGHVLVVADSGQIEARVLAWLAKQTDKLGTFRKNDEKTARYAHKRRLLIEVNGLSEAQADARLREEGVEEGDLYAEAGTRYFGRKVTKKDTPVERQVAKSIELGLGFELGSFTFAGGLLKGFLGAPPVQFTPEQARQFGVDVYAFANEPMWPDGPTGEVRTRELLETGLRVSFDDLLVHFAVTHYFVRLYRQQNSRIAALWKTMVELVKAMEAGANVRYGPVVTFKDALSKPTGLKLLYPKLHRSGDGYKYWGWKGGREQWIKVYGGLMTENVVQSLARDIVAEQALHVRAAGYRVVTTTHDEIVAVAPEADGERALELMLRVMRTPPEWCKDLPLNASGAMAKSYGDAK